MLRYILPFQRAHFVDLYLRSGAVLHFTCTNLTRQERGDHLTGLKAEGALGWPIFISLDDVCAVQTRPIWRRRP